MNQRVLIFGVVFFSVLITSSCNPDSSAAPSTANSTDPTDTPAVIVETVVVEKEGERVVETVVVTAEPDEEIFSEESNCCSVYRIGILEEPRSFNYWYHLGQGGSVWTDYLIGDDPARLFELSDQRFQFVPSLAKGIPPISDDGNGTWSITVEMVEDALWSDGESITAEDVVFTHNVCKDMQLGLFWPDYCAPGGADVTMQAIDQFSLQIVIRNQAPTIESWQAGVALIPILPEHFWTSAVTEAYSFIDDLDLPVVDRPENCSSTVLTESDQDACSAWEKYDQAYSNARTSLYSADANGQPVAGGYVKTTWEPGEYIEQEANENYYFRGAEVVEYEDGTWMRIMPDGTEYQFYGSAVGQETLRYTSGPHNPGVTFYIYDSHEAAYAAFFEGQVDYVLTPLPFSKDYRELVGKYKDHNTFVNTSYNMFYMAFNTQREPMLNYEFRRVFDIIVDKDFIANKVLGGSVIPLSSTMPAGNYNWYFDRADPHKDLSRKERLELAVQVLKDAGWSWESEPFWDDYFQSVVPGEGLVTPNGERLPELTLIAPGAEFDPIRATYSLWISEWARQLGIVLKTELVGRDAILDNVFVDADFDMYVYGWSLGSPQFPGYYERFWHSRNCTVETGGRNAPCFKNAEYDALVDEFISTTDLTRARELVQKMENLLADQRPYIPLFSTQIYELAHENVIFPYTETLGGIEAQSGFQTDTKVLLTE